MMKKPKTSDDVKKLFPDSGAKEGDGFLPLTSIKPIVFSLAPVIVFEASDEFAVRALFRNDEEYGFLLAAHTLSSCGSYEDVEALHKELEGKIQWHKTAKECLVHVATGNWQQVPGSDYNATREFVLKCKGHLMEVCGE